MIDLDEVGAHVTHGGGQSSVRIGVYLPGIRFADGYRVKVRVIHRRDQFVAGIDPLDFDLFCHDDHALDLWDATIDMTAHSGVGSFGEKGTYLYRFQLLRGQEVVVEWFSDPFARRSAPGTHAAFVLDSNPSAFTWSDDTWRTPEIDDLVVYELHVDEFNRTFDGVVDRLDYLHGLGVNVLELMPVSNVKEDIEWGYTPLGYFAPDERYGGPDGMKRLVDACHGRGIAVIVDAVYAHAHAEFPYSLVYDRSGEPNPMMGVFQGEFFDRHGADYAKEFTREFFLTVSRYWIAEYHIDGFRYDYVPGMYEGPTGRGYSRLVHRTYDYSKSVSRFDAGDGTDRSRLIQCAEHLPDPKGILRSTYTNCCWQNSLLDKAEDMGKHGYVDDQFVHLLDPSFIDYPEQYSHPTSGDSFPVAPFQYIETHDHGRFLSRVAPTGHRDVLGQPFGDRGQFYRVQPFIIAIYTAKGIPMLWQGQEFAENWGVPHDGFGRILFRRDVHWEHFYDREGRSLLRLHRRLGELRRGSSALKSRGYFFYYADAQQRQRGVVCFRRESTGAGGESLLVFLNFSSSDQQAWAPFPHAGTWTEILDSDNPGGPHSVTVSSASDWHAVTVPAHYGAIYRLPL